MTANTDRLRCVPQPCRAGGPCGPAGRQGQARKPEATSAAAPGQSAEKNAAQAVQSRARPQMGVAAFKDEVRHEQEQGERLRQVRLGRSPRSKKDDDEDEADDEGRGERREEVQGRARRSSASPRSRSKYGTNTNKANAFGKCVSKLAKGKTLRRELTSQDPQRGGGTGCGGRGKRRRRSRGLLRRCRVVSGSSTVHGDRPRTRPL